MVGDSIRARRRGRSREVVHTCQASLVWEHLGLIVTLGGESLVAWLLVRLLAGCCSITEGVGGVAPGGCPHGHQTNARVARLTRQFPQLLLAADTVVVPGGRSLSGTGAGGSCHSTAWSHVQQHPLGAGQGCILQGLVTLSQLLLPIIRTGWETATLLNVIRMNR